MLRHALTALLGLAATPTGAFNPYTPTASWEYYIEAAHVGPAASTAWPACPFRFLSFPTSCDALNLWSGVGVNQKFKLVAGSKPGTFAIEAGCGKPLGYSANCEDQEVQLGPAPLQHDFTVRFLTISQQLCWFSAVFSVTCGIFQRKIHLTFCCKTPQFAQDAQSFEWTIEAAGRSSCAYKYVSFPAASCSATQPVPVTLEGGGGGPLTSTFRIHAAAGPTTRKLTNKLLLLVIYAPHF